MVKQTLLTIGTGVSRGCGIVGSFDDQKRFIKENHRILEDFAFSIDIDT